MLEGNQEEDGKWGKSEWEEERIEFYSRKGRGIEKQRGENINKSKTYILKRKKKYKRGEMGENKRVAI